MSANPGPEVAIRALTIDDYEPVYTLWVGTPGIGLSSADERSAVESYLRRNPCLSSVAHVGDRIIGAVLSGHDGRRGFLHHLVVDSDHRGHGIGRHLVRRSLDLLASEGIQKCHIFIFGRNEDGKAFWRAIDFEARDDSGLFSRLISAPGVEGR